MNISNSTDQDDIIIQALIYFSTSGILFLCLISLMIYTLIKPLL